ncbi:outer membrane protein OmpV [Grimontia marina]|uniref:Outer membrane protein OmpV n=1 Tax=Grimontia marina TaxID=646534 RepID=A0A128FIP0_9GAMM|nr:MipA/OmpV family protein [Grimontia marina]CZF86649.1 Outer membrane protein OmpV precursor [Grimontia marina]
MNKSALLFSILAAAPAVQAANQTYILNGNIYSKQSSWIAEAGVAATSDLYKEQDHSVVPLLNFGYHGEDFNIDFSGANYRFYGTDGDLVNLGVHLTSAGIGYDDDTSDFLKGMDDRDISVDLGLNADFQVGTGVISTYFQHDISGAYKGYLAGVRYFDIFPIGDADLVSFAGVMFQSKDFVDYYFGVQPKEARANRPEYTGKSSVAYEVGYKLIYPISENWNLTQSTQYTELGSDVADSPIVDSKHQWLVGATVAYHF